MKDLLAFRTAGLVAGILCACAACAPAAKPAAEGPTLAGAWQSSVQFQSGAFAGVKDLAFMYAYAADGTLLESSNYDAAPPVPPAYGNWRHVSGNQFEAHYAFFTTRQATAAEAAAASGGWLPAGHGELAERITLAADGQSYEATITVALFDAAGKAVEGGGAGTVHAQRMAFTK
ncbi:MAG: hypothetical protein U1F30_10900 [Steroidobacteraceae bacterium]